MINRTLRALVRHKMSKKKKKLLITTNIQVHHFIYQSKHHVSITVSKTKQNKTDRIVNCWANTKENETASQVMVLYSSIQWTSCKSERLKKRKKKKRHSWSQSLHYKTSLVHATSLWYSWRVDLLSKLQFLHKLKRNLHA